MLGEERNYESPSPIILPGPRERTQEEPDSPSGFTRMEILLTAIIALATIAQAVMAYHQWRTAAAGLDAAKRQTEASQEAVRIARQALASGDEGFTKTLEQARRQADAAQQTAKSADATYRRAEQSFRLQQRPWLVVYRARMQPPTPNKPFELYWVLENSGLSPALGVEVRSRVLMGRVPKTEDFDRTPSGPVFVLLPRISFEHTPKVLPMSAEQVRIFQEGAIVYLFGKISYKDMFGEPHRTQFCTEFRWDRETSKIDQRLCERFNEAT